MLTHSYSHQLLRSLNPVLLEACANDWDLSARVSPGNLPGVLLFLKSNSPSRFSCLSGLAITDYPESQERFVLSYLLLSHRFGTRFALEVCAPDGAFIPSASSVYSVADWMEREAWDMFGIFFGKHPDFRRILCDYGFVGHPLRKDFPLSGFVEVRYDSSRARLVYEPLELSQEYRNFSFNNPWKN